MHLGCQRFKRAKHLKYKGAHRGDESTVTRIAMTLGPRSAFVTNRTLPPCSEPYTAGETVKVQE